MFHFESNTRNNLIYANECLAGEFIETKKSF